MSEPNVVYFAHGKDSGPWGSKIQLLAKLAEAQGLAVESPDYQDLETGQDRLEKLNHLLAQDTRSPILVGSSMGGWVSAQMAASQPCEGLFLMAPAFEMPDHESAPLPNEQGAWIIHGSDDDVVPIEQSQQRIRRGKDTLLNVPDGHRLARSHLVLAHFFQAFLAS